MSLDEPGLETVAAGSDNDPAEPDRRHPADDVPSTGDPAQGVTAFADPAEPTRASRAEPAEFEELALSDLADPAEAARGSRLREDTNPPQVEPLPERPDERSVESPPDRAAGDEPRSRKRRARKVRRIVRRFDAWSVLKFSLLFFLCLFLITMVAGVLLWNAAQRAGTIEGFEGFIEELGGYDSFRFEGDQIFNAALLSGLVLVVAGSAGNVLLAVLFNLISDLTGGIRVTVIEEERIAPPVERRPRTKQPKEPDKSRPHRSLTEMSSEPDIR